MSERKMPIVTEHNVSDSRMTTCYWFADLQHKTASIRVRLKSRNIAVIDEVVYVVDYIGSKSLGYSISRIM